MTLSIFLISLSCLHPIQCPTSLDLGFNTNLLRCDRTLMLVRQGVSGLMDSRATFCEDGPWLGIPMSSILNLVATLQQYEMKL